MLRRKFGLDYHFRQLEPDDVVKELCESVEGLGQRILSFIHVAEMAGLWVRVRELGIDTWVRKPVIKTRIGRPVIATLVVHWLRRAGRVEEALNALGELRDIGWEPDAIAYAIAAERFRHMGDWWIPLAHPNEYCEVLYGLVKEGRILEAKELMEAIAHGSFVFDAQTLSLLEIKDDAYLNWLMLILDYKFERRNRDMLGFLRIRKHKSGDAADKMVDILRILLDKGFLSWVEEYNLMAEVFCVVGKLREAQDMFTNMKNRGIAPGHSCYVVLMEAYCEEDLLDPAKKFLDEMFANEYPDSFNQISWPLYTLVKKLSEVGKVEEAQHFFDRMIKKGGKVNHEAYEYLIKGWCREKNIEKAIEIFNKSIEHGATIGDSPLDTLMLGLCTEGNYIVASTIMYGLPREVRGDWSYFILIKSLTDAGEVDMAIKHMKRIQNECPTTLKSVFKNLMYSLSTAPKIEPVLQLLRCMHVEGLFPEENPWSDLLNS